MDIEYAIYVKKIGNKWWVWRGKPEDKRPKPNKTTDRSFDNEYDADAYAQMLRLRDVIQRQ